jgi:hypothetical protein
MCVCMYWNRFANNQHFIVGLHLNEIIKLANLILIVPEIRF